MLHLIYKKLKKQKILLLSTSFSLAPTLLVSCFQPYQEMQKHISKSLVPTPGSYNPKSANPVAGNPILEENSDTITNSVLGFNGQKKNPKEAKNRFNVEKNYTEEIPEASFIPNKGGTGKYGLLPYWYFLQSIPEYLKKKGFNTYKYNKEEYLKRLDYFYEKIRGYYNRNLVDYQSPGVQGEVEVWKQGLRKSYEDFIKKMNGKSTYDFNEDLTDKDKVSGLNDIRIENFWPIIRPELDKYKAKIDENDDDQKNRIIFDFLLANERMWPAFADENGEYINGNRTDKWKNTARYFRDDYYIKTRYKPSDPEKLWYELGWFMLRPQRIISSANKARSILESIWEIEKQFFELNDKNIEPAKLLAGKLANPIRSFTNILENFLKPHNHLNLRKDLVFNIDASNNQDDQSLIADFIDYYNQKIAPIIWRINLTAPKLDTLTNLIHDNSYFNTYLQPLLPKIQDLPTQEDAKIGNNYSEELKEKARQGAKKAGQKAWGQWLKNYQDKYGIQFKADPEIDNEYYDESNSSVVKPEKTKEIEKEKLTKETKETKEELPKETKVS
ncbi:hypothetical protein [Mycoplasma sp. 'Moose RK']|uniref:hypothetical protein n=1 Tax=Mycoplasma sp. 'Moose RK' TaxID=2780095 RepID=UPI001E2FA836|nr:hypothetical protein [Mycoplasma sp. 'Moose RK']